VLIDEHPAAVRVMRERLARFEPESTKPARVRRRP
jgi:hypothetical protein